MVDIGGRIIGIANTEYDYKAEDRVLDNLELLIPQFGSDVQDLMRSLMPVNTTRPGNRPADPDAPQTKTVITANVTFANPGISTGGDTLTLVVEYSIVSEKRVSYSFYQPRAWGNMAPFVKIQSIDISPIIDTSIRPIPAEFTVEYEFTLTE